MHSQDLRIGHGYDLHRLDLHPPQGSGRPFILGGIEIAHDRGPIGHSDGDCVAHAVTDALLGAIGQPDIGEIFPDTDPQWEGADSMQFVEKASRMVTESGRRVVNMDITVICERPKISPHKAAIINNLSRVLGVDPTRMNLKGKTHEKVDAVGEGRAIEVHVVALLAPIED